jgi:hypothetical protein
LCRGSARKPDGRKSDGEIVADNRDRLADDCGVALDEYWNAVDRITGGKVNE